ncbi:hypothetical protein Q31b_33650 [Novipirellula aureliae]|uniref:Uncharacterized protein n=1 Tax=Novipirellula aureliae TaxID=2527966 RepID=A0A5C6DXA7_9BACT|nr:hypothetical protein Q31b_33650 [Novipirellula aureliae]
MKASVTSDANTPGHYHSTVARRRDCLRVSVRVDWIEYSLTSESSLLAPSVNVTCVFKKYRRIRIPMVRQKSHLLQKTFSADDTSHEHETPLKLESPHPTQPLSEAFD